MVKKVAVLMGGWSDEREVSLSSGKGVSDALKEAGYDVTDIDVTRDVPQLVENLKAANPDVVFNILHGPGGEDGVIQSVLEILQIPYTFSGVLASAAAMDKLFSKKVFMHENVPTPPWKVVSKQELTQAPPLPYPFVVKPINDGSSNGVRLIFNEPDYHKALEFVNGSDWHYPEDLLVEQYIPGREIQVAVMGDKAIGSIEICPKEGFYDYEAKYTPGKADHKMPAPIPAEDYQRTLDYALKAHKALGCRGVSRVDMRYDDTNGAPAQLYVLEVNTQPGMTPLSLVPEIAEHTGITFPELVSWMVENAQCDHQNKQ